MRSFFSLFHKIKHFLKAKNLHGVHSPFVYSFNEEILNGRSIFQNLPHYQLIFSFLKNQNQIDLLSRMGSHYHFSKINFEGNEIYRSDGNEQNGVLWVITDAQQFPLLNHEHDIVMMLDIYSSKMQFTSWEILCHQELVRLSIDTYDAGVLFFKKDFLEKQHFLLKF